MCSLAGLAVEVSSTPIWYFAPNGQQPVWSEAVISSARKSPNHFFSPLSQMADKPWARGDDAQAGELAERAKQFGDEPPVIPPELLAAFESRRRRRRVRCVAQTGCQDRRRWRLGITNNPFARLRRDIAGRAAAIRSRSTSRSGRRCLAPRMTGFQPFLNCPSAADGACSRWNLSILSLRSRTPFHSETKINALGAMPPDRKQPRQSVLML